LFMMVVLMQGPTFVAQYLAGLQEWGVCVGLFITNAVILVLVFTFTFRNFRSALPSAFMMTAVHEVLVMFGIL
ncbi:hypothetical protein ACFLQK_01870, partial [bacterium]